VNVALPRAPLDSPVLADFVAAIEGVNALAGRSPGFVWQLQFGDADATEVPGLEDGRLVVNLSVWESVAALRAFTYSGPEHREVLRRRAEWFERLSEPHLALWWVRRGHRPSVEEAGRRLAHLREHGPTAHAFTFRASFTPSGRPARPRRRVAAAAG
jgi:heme-degrading monooxygenase HmoA